MGTMFRGQFEHAIDVKGRTSLPSRFRDVLGADAERPLVVTPDMLDPCLHVYPMTAWEELEAKVASMPRFDQGAVAFRRRYISAAVECELDKQGRILIPPNLRDRAGLTKGVVWAGMGEKLELWAAERWQQPELSPDEIAQFKSLAEQFRL